MDDDNRVNKSPGPHGRAPGEGPELARLVQGARALGITVTESQGRQLLAYQHQLLVVNESCRLTAIRSAAEALEKHLLDSISPLRVLSPDRWAAAIDVGSGGGLPGIPLKIMCPAGEMTLLDAAGKRVRALQKMIDSLGLRGIHACHGRAEEKAREDGFRDSFDLALARAVAPLAVLVELCLPLVRPGGVMVALKGPALAAELPAASRAIQLLSGEIELRDSFTLPFSGARRELVRIRKVAPTAAGFPRRPGVPARRPL